MNHFYRTVIEEITDDFLASLDRECTYSLAMLLFRILQQDFLLKYTLRPESI